MQTTRRRFLAGAGSLVIGVALPLKSRAHSGAAAVIAPDAPFEAPFAPNAFVRVSPDNTVTVLVKHIEFGQGPYTGLSTLVAEEMDADWGQMRATAAPANAALYANTIFGVQGTGGSTAIANSYIQMRKAGAAARKMLLDAAARTWGLSADDLLIENGVIRHADGHSATFGEMAAEATNSDVPSDPPLKDPSQFKLIGTNRPKLDSAQKSTGKADFTIDVYREGMATVAVLHPPKFGATLKEFDATAALAVSGVTRVERVPSGVAVYGKNTHAALKGRRALTATWDETNAETRSSDEMETVWAAAAREGGLTAEESGDVDAALAAADTVLGAEYIFPMLAHAPLEPLDAVLEWDGAKADLWMGSQLQTVDHQVAASTLGLDLAAVNVHTMMAGGSFGRRAQPTSHVAAEVAAIAKAGGPGAYKLLWSREDDIKGGYYRPLTVHRLRGGLDANGNIVAWHNVLANQSIIAGSPFAMMMQDGLDPTAYEGSTKMPYAWPAHRVEWRMMESQVPVLWWRAVGHTHTAYATETFLDELLAAGGKDPVQGRLDLLSDGAGRDRGVLQRVAEMANWQGPKGADGRAYGVALHESFNTYVAMIAEVSHDEGMPKVHQMWIAVDCGVAVNPNVITAQMEGGAGFGLGTALHNAIHLDPGGTVRESNFDRYRLLRINEMPKIHVSILESSEPPTGVGEPGTPPVAPAIGSAMRVLTGTTPKRLPFADAITGNDA
ncbi:MAG: xanthine dehydrogenase family protein molybdopterin-binding subunit [Pseudomonadota bacterium]